MAEAERALKGRIVAVTQAQLGVLERMSSWLAARDYYLAGGTALALQLGHRKSVDLDFFCSKPVHDPLALFREIQDDVGGLTATHTERGTLHGVLSGVRVSFIEYRYPVLRKPVVWKRTGARLASLEDIACMKLAAIAHRGARKDFVDVFALGQRLSLARMLVLFGRKYAMDDIGHILIALTYFDDAEAERMPKLFKPWTWAKIKDTIRRWVADYCRHSAG
jgi:hypothetical protein